MRGTRDWKKLVISPDTSILQTLRVVDRGASGVALIADPEGRLLGMVTDGDIRRGILRGVDLSDPVSRVMTPDPATAAPGTSDTELLEELEERRLRHLPLVDDDGKLCGLAVLDDLVAKEELGIPAVLMAGGLGSRLRPLTDHTPKPLLEVGGSPILQTILTHLRGNGVQQFFISTRHLADQIEEHFGDGNKLGVQIDYVRETERLGTAGALHLLKGSVEGPLLVMNGDVLTNVRIADMVRFHKERGGSLTVAVRPYNVEVPFGVLEMQGEDIAGIVEKPSYRHFVNAGVYVIDSSLLDLVPDGEYFDMPQLIERTLGEGRRVMGFPLHEYWRDIGRHEDFAQANMEYEEIFGTEEAG